jgi:CheY-like chemotaxis protein
MARSAHPRATVLIVEDDEPTLETFACILADDGYAVRAATNAEAGLAEIGRSHPDAVLLDLHMPTVDGLAYLRHIRSEPGHADVPVAILTGDYFLDEHVAGELRSRGARIHIKPVWDTDLRRIVDELIESGRHRPGPHGR